MVHYWVYLIAISAGNFIYRLPVICFSEFDWGSKASCLLGGAVKGITIAINPNKLEKNTWKLYYMVIYSLIPGTADQQPFPRSPPSKKSPSDSDSN